MSKAKPKKYTAKLLEFVMDTLNKAGDQYVRLHFQIEQEVKEKTVTKTYYLTSQTAKEHLFDELGKMGHRVSSMYDVQNALESCKGLRVHLKVKNGDNGRTSYYILGRCDESLSANELETMTS